MTPGDRLPRDMELSHSHRILEKVNASDCLPSRAPCWGGTWPSVPCQLCSGRSGTKSLVLVAEPWSWCERSLGLSQSHRPEHPARSGPAASACKACRPGRLSQPQTLWASPGCRENGVVSFPRGLGEAYCRETRGSRCCLAPNPHKGSDTSGGE